MIATAIHHLAREFSVNRQEWREHFQGGDALLDALVSHGYAIERDGRFAVTNSGRARLEDEHG